MISPLLSGEATTQSLKDDDLQYVEDLGLIWRRPELRIANRIYREVLPRELVAPVQTVLHYPQHWYVAARRPIVAVVFRYQGTVAERGVQVTFIQRSSLHGQA